MPLRPSRRLRRGAARPRTGDTPSPATAPPAKRVHRLRRSLLTVLGAALSAALIAWLTGGLQWIGNEALDAVRGEEEPFTITTQRPDPTPSPTPSSEDQSWTGKYGAIGVENGSFAAGARSECDHYAPHRFVRAAASDVRPPEEGENLTEKVRDWVARYDAADADSTSFGFLVQGKPGKTTVLTGLRAEYLDRQPAAESGTLVKLSYTQCGDASTPRVFDLALDDPSGRLLPAEGETTNFPYTVSYTDPELFVITAETAQCDCTWRLALSWSSDGMQAVTYLDNHDGAPFHTAPAAPDSPTKHWVHHGTPWREQTD